MELAATRTMTKAVILTIVLLLCSADAEALPVTRSKCSSLIAFASNRSQDAQPEIYAIALDGTRTDVSRSIVPDEYPQPSPDGSKVAFGRTDSTGSTALLVADANGSHQRTLGPWAPVSWAPDSRRVAASVTMRGRSTVMIFDAQTGARSLLGPGIGPQWSPDGSLIAAVGVPGTDEAGAVFVERPDGSDHVKIGDGYDPRWSPDGAHVLVTTGASSAVLSPLGAPPVVLPNFVALTWTPDGSRLIGTTTTGVVTLESVSLDGADSHVISETSVTADRHLLSPDGRSLVFARPPDGDVVVTDLEGKLVRDLGSRPWPGQTVFDPRWSPDGRHVLLWTEQRQPIVADVATGAVQTLVRPTETTDQPVWSPDGSVLATVTDTRSNTHVYVARVDGTGARRISSDTAPEDTPAWSPDGTRVAYIRDVGSGALMVADLHGHVRTVGHLSAGVWVGCCRPQWSADGKHIAVAVSRGIEIVDVDTGRTHMLRRRYSQPAGISPDARTIAYVYGVGGDRERIGVDSRSGRRLWSVPVGNVSSDTDPSEPGIAGPLAWSPDGRWLAFERFGTGQYGDFDFSIQVIDARRHGLAASVPLGDSPLSWVVYAPAEFLAFDGFDWSPDSRALVQGGFDAEITRRDGHHLATLPGLRAEDPAWQPRCTAAGKRRLSAATLAVQADRQVVAQAEPRIAFAARRGIYVMDADGRNAHLVAAQRDAENPAWSPNGRWLAFDANGSIFVMNPDGSGRRLLIHLKIAAEPSWSPDSREIVFDAGYQVDVINADGTGLRKLVSNTGGGNFAAPNWSPDGRRIAFSYGLLPGRDFGIAVINVDGTGLRKLTNRSGGSGHLYDSAPRWSPDGKRIVFYQEFDCACESSNPADHPFDVVVMNADGSHERALTHDHVSENPSWSPDGREIAYDTFTQIHVMNADGTAKRRLTTGHHGGVEPAWSPTR
jgi:TolB protein